MHPPPWLQNLLHRRVPQFLGAYLGAGLALIPFVGFLVDTYDLPKALLNAVIVAYVSVIQFSIAKLHQAQGEPAHPGSNVQMARLERARGDLAAARRHLDVALAVWADADPEFRMAKEARELDAELGG